MDEHLQDGEQCMLGSDMIRELRANGLVTRSSSANLTQQSSNVRAVHLAPRPSWARIDDPHAILIEQLAVARVDIL